MSALKNKKSLDKIKMGDLRMAEAEVIFLISKISEKIKEVDKKTDAELLSCTKVLSDFETVSSAKRISNLVREKKELIQRLQFAEKKKSAVARLIQLKDEKSMVSSKKSDIFRHLDIEELAFIREEKDIQTEIEEMRLDRILDESNDSHNKYNKILDIVKSVNLDDESVEIAKTELEDLVFE